MAFNITNYFEDLFDLERGIDEFLDRNERSAYTAIYKMTKTGNSGFYSLTLQFPITHYYKSACSTPMIFEMPPYFFEPGVLGFAIPSACVGYVRNNLPPELKGKVKNHEATHILKPYLSEGEVRRETDTTEEDIDKILGRYIV